MTTIQQNLLNPNNQPLIIGEFSIRQDEDGRYCLNDLHKASGGLAKHKPSNFIRNQQTQELIVEIEQVSDVSCANFDRCSNMSIGQKAINTVKGGVKQGMYVVEDLVYSYAMWISAKFHLMVIRAYRAQVMEWMIGGKQTISPEQAGILYNIVHTRAGENKNLIVQMWSRLKNHFKYSASYRELRAIHFEDAKHYLEVMDLKGKQTAPEKPTEQVKPLDGEVYELVRQLTEAIILENDEIVPILQAVKIIDVKKFAYLSHKVVWANERARDLSRVLNFRNKLDEPLIDENCRVISLSTGQRFIARPNWFNCPA
ncbi:KilA-N domain-containing protein [Acinetobacter sp.]|uniref:KilA-N domain-containing protein n=1 Tax=Acinetobacter sp. TaxID=472 RepID=UPI0028AC27E5|nr:KilA-N domain-containing protein [Acinetobacter sp.]